MSLLNFPVHSLASGWMPGFWGTAGCLIYETAWLLRDIVSFLPELGDFAFSSVTSWSSFMNSLELYMRQKGAEFLKLHPEYAQLLPDSFSVFSLLMWLLALSFLFGHIFLALRSRLRCNPEVLFFPDSSGVHVRHICHMLRSARRRMWIAMFTLTDDVLSQEILNAWARNVDVKVILDDEQCHALGSDASKLSQFGVPLLLDSSPARMHHKFAVLDDCVLTGSFNWTKQASMSNWENLCILREPAAVKPFAREFQSLWHDFTRREQSFPTRKRDGTPPRR